MRNLGDHHRIFATQSPPTLPDLCPLSGELAGQFPGAVMFDAALSSPQPAHEPCGRPGQPQCPEALGNVPALPGTGVVSGAWIPWATCSAASCPCHFSTMMAPLAGHWAT